MYTITKVNTKKDLEVFLRVPFFIYRNDPLWVPPLISKLKAYLTGRRGYVFSTEHEFYLVYQGARAVGRLAVGINRRLNEVKNLREAFFTLYEAAPDPAISQLLFQQAEGFARSHHLTSLKGPFSPTNGDDFLGLLVDGFERLPYILTSYNPPYYLDHLEVCGFKPGTHFLGFTFDLAKLDLADLERRVSAIRQRIGFDIHQVDFRHTQEAVHHIHRIMTESMLPEWNYLTTPSEQELLQEARKLKSFTFPSFVQIAYRDNQPIGFGAVLPNYNQVLKDLKGTLFPIGWIHFFQKRHSINQARAFLLFVIPEFQGKGVSRALLLELFRAARNRGYREAEGSLINATNRKMCLEAEGTGGKIARKFALFKKSWS